MKKDMRKIKVSGYFWRTLYKRRRPIVAYRLDTID
jgi:hypothetical protein